MNNNNRKPLLLLLGGFIWRMISALRIIVFNLLFLAIIAVFISFWLESRPEPIPERAPLLISPAGELVDQERYIDPTSRLLSPTGPQETELRELIEVIRFAARDDRVSALLLRLDDLEGGGLSKLQELGAAIDDFKAGGKPVIAFSDTFNQQQYFLASFADEIHMHDLGYVMLTGYELYRNYFQQAIEKLSLNFYIFKVGGYKDFIEPFTRSDMSDASREHNKQWLESLWSDYTEHVEQRRNLSSGTVNHIINHAHDHLARTEGNPTQLALQMNFVDQVHSRPARNRALIERFGHVEDDEHQLRHINYERYSQEVLKRPSRQEGNIGLIVGRGVILDGHQPEGAIGGESMSQLIRRARLDDQISALVLRIDSGGGSVFASELIRQELQATRDAGKPVVVSMGGLAASGGYWIAMGADEIWATPTTLTGSIGVFGVFPNLEESLAKIGITTDGLGTTEVAGGLRLDRPLSPIAEDALQQGVEFVYDRFIKLVAENRDTSIDAIHQIAQGRVWTGAHAHDLGLVDHLGYLDDAIAAAAQRADVRRPQVKLIQRELSPQEALMRALFTEASSAGLRADALLPTSAAQRRLLSKMNALWEPHAPLFDQPKGFNTLALCLACVAP